MLAEVWQSRWRWWCGRRRAHDVIHELYHGGALVVEHTSIVIVVELEHIDLTIEVVIIIHIMIVVAIEMKACIIIIIV